MSKKYNKNVNINSVQVKSDIIDYVFKVIEMGKYKYKLIQHFNDLTILTKDKYYVSPNFTGKNCLMVFTKLKDIYYSVLLDRKTLKYNKSYIKIEQVKIIPINHIMANKNIYDGTIIEGKLLHNQKFYITDIYFLDGRDKAGESIKSKLDEFSTYIDKYIKIDQNNNKFDLEINKLYVYNDIQFIIDNFKESPYKMYGIIFYPNISGTTLLFNNIFENDKPITNDNVCILLKKTTITDVYETYLLNDENELIKYDIAYIPTMECSKYCQEIFKNTSKCIFKCAYNTKFDKWSPIEKLNIDKPDNINKIINLLQK